MSAHHVARDDRLQVHATMQGPTYSVCSRQFCGGGPQVGKRRCGVVWHVARFKVKGAVLHVLGILHEVGLDFFAQLLVVLAYSEDLDNPSKVHSVPAHSSAMSSHCH